MKDIKDFINMTSLYNEYTLLEATSQELAKDLYATILLLIYEMK